ncbi:serine hydrolase [Bacillus cereus]
MKHKNQATHKEFSQLEKKFDARVGVYAIDTGTNQTISYRSNERFAFASTYKALAAGVLLQQNSIDTLNEVITFTKRRLSGLFTCYRETCRYWNETRRNC